MAQHSRYAVYVDEAGDHGPVSKEFPVFVLTFLVFDKLEYAEKIVPAFHAFKFRQFGHDDAVLHEREIRKALNLFGFLKNAKRRDEFHADLSQMIETSKFTVISVVIDKARLRKMYRNPFDPYDLAMRYGLERVASFLNGRGDKGLVHVMFESRGKAEDAALELEFRRVVATPLRGKVREMDIKFASKKANHCGLQLADLIARPVGRHVLMPDQPNRAFEIIKDKFFSNQRGETRNVGLKVFPEATKAERPGYSPRRSADRDSPVPELRFADDYDGSQPAFLSPWNR